MKASTKKTSCVLGLLAGLAAAPDGAAAADFYASVNLGIGASDEYRFDAFSNGSHAGANEKTDTGIVGNAVLGYRYSPSMRFEVELGARHNDIDQITPDSSSACDAVAGDVWVGTAMANALYDFRDVYGVTPFVGGGAGLARVDMDATAGGSECTLGQGDGQDTVFAYQFKAGAGYPLSENTILDFTYSLLRMNDVSFTGDNGEGQSGIELSYERMQQHAVMVGLRYSF